MLVPHKENKRVTEKEALQNAADEARKAARAGREFAGQLDDYAKYLTQPNWRQRADETYRSALNKLNVINEGLAACHKLIEESGEAAAADSLKQEALKQTALQQQSESEAITKHEIEEKRKPRSIRIAKKAVGK
jgi:hypothetical protein